MDTKFANLRRSVKESLKSMFLVFFLSVGALFTYSKTAGAEEVMGFPHCSEITDRLENDDLVRYFALAYEWYYRGDKLLFPNDRLGEMRLSDCGVFFILHIPSKPPVITANSITVSLGSDFIIFIRKLPDRLPIPDEMDWNSVQLFIWEF